MYEILNLCLHKSQLTNIRRSVFFKQIASHVLKMAPTKVFALDFLLAVVVRPMQKADLKKIHVSKR